MVVATLIWRTLGGFIAGKFFQLPCQNKSLSDKSFVQISRAGGIDFRIHAERFQPLNQLDISRIAKPIVNAFGNR